MRNFLILVVGSMLSSAWSLPLFAHHSFITHYDASRSMQLQGTVVDFSFRSPHSFLYIDAENERGCPARC